jgi:hypothetical protein
MIPSNINKEKLIQYLLRCGFLQEKKVGDEYYIFETSEIRIEILFYGGTTNMFGKFISEDLECRVDKTNPLNTTFYNGFENTVHFLNNEFKHIFRKNIIHKLLNDTN